MIHKLRNTSVRELIRALEKDGFQYTRRKERILFVGFRASTQPT